MSTIEWVFGIILAIFAIAIIIVVLLQEGHQKDLGTVTGGADTFFDKNQARSIDAFLVCFFILAIVINVISFFSTKAG